MTTWRERADAVIAQVHASLPADADLKTRRRAVKVACPIGFRATSWGRKTWGKATQAYLMKFGAKSRKRGRDANQLELVLSPLDRAKRATTSDIAKLHLSGVPTPPWAGGLK